MQKTLDDVVLAGQQGMQFSQQRRDHQQQQQRDQLLFDQQQQQFAQQQADKAKERALMDSSEQAVRGVMQEDMATHVANGGDPAQYKPSSRAMLRSVEARSAVFAKAGDVRRLMENEVIAEKPRLQMRARALQQYEATGRTNFGEFAKEFYATLPNGIDVTGYDEVPGGAPDAPKGAPSGKTMYRLRLSNGKSDLVDPEKLYESAQQMLQDPLATAKQMAEMAVKRQLAQVKGEEDRKKVTLENAEKRTTAAEKATEERIKADEAFQRQLQLVDRQQAGQMRLADKHGGYTLAAARERRGNDDGSSDVKNLTQANRAVETARNALAQATDGAVKVRLGGFEGQDMKTAARIKLIDDDPQVQAAREAYQQARSTRDRLAASTQPTLEDAKPSAPKPAAQATQKGTPPALMRFDKNGNLVN